MSVSAVSGFLQLPRWACALFGAQVPAQPVVRHAGPAGAAGAAAAAQHLGQQQQQPGARHQVRLLTWCLRHACIRHYNKISAMRLPSPG